jgi:hypothetical protein
MGIGAEGKVLGARQRLPGHACWQDSGYVSQGHAGTGVAVAQGPFPPEMMDFSGRYATITTHRGSKHTILSGDVDMKRMLLGAGVLALAVLTTFGMTVAQEKGDKPKHTIKQVMKEAHKSGLWKKVAAGKATPEEQKQLAELYESLAKNEPPKGDKKSWEEKTSALVKGAKEAQEGKGEALGKAANCMACHKEHKGA